MAEPSRNDGTSSSLPEFRIPTGLNRIKTRRAVNSISGDEIEDSDQFNESPSSGFSISATHMKQKLKGFNEGHAKFARSKQGFGVVSYV